MEGDKTANNEKELTSTSTSSSDMDKLLSTNKEEKNDSNDTLPTSSTDASTSIKSSHLVSDDPISSTSSEMDSIKSKIDGKTTVGLMNKTAFETEEELEISMAAQPSEKIEENVDDLVSDLETLLGESIESSILPSKPVDNKRTDVSIEELDDLLSDKPDNEVSSNTESSKVVKEDLIEKEEIVQNKDDLTEDAETVDMQPAISLSSNPSSNQIKKLAEYLVNDPNKNENNDMSNEEKNKDHSSKTSSIDEESEETVNKKVELVNDTQSEREKKCSEIEKGIETTNESLEENIELKQIEENSKGAEEKISESKVDNSGPEGDQKSEKLCHESKISSESHHLPTDLKECSGVDQHVIEKQVQMNSDDVTEGGPEAISEDNTTENLELKASEITSGDIKVPESVSKNPKTDGENEEVPVPITSEDVLSEVEEVSNASISKETNGENCESRATEDLKNDEPIFKNPKVDDDIPETNLKVEKTINLEKETENKSSDTADVAGRSTPEDSNSHPVPATEVENSEGETVDITEKTLKEVIEPESEKGEVNVEPKESNNKLDISNLDETSAVSPSSDMIEEANKKGQEEIEISELPANASPVQEAVIVDMEPVIEEPEENTPNAAVVEEEMEDTIITEIKDKEDKPPDTEEKDMAENDNKDMKNTDVEITEEIGDTETENSISKDTGEHSLSKTIITCDENKQETVPVDDPETCEDKQEKTSIQNTCDESKQETLPVDDPETCEDKQEKTSTQNTCDDNKQETLLVDDPETSEDKQNENSTEPKLAESKDDPEEQRSELELVLSEGPKDVDSSTEDKHIGCNEQFCETSNEDEKNMNFDDVQDECINIGASVQKEKDDLAEGNPDAENEGEVVKEETEDTDKSKSSSSHRISEQTQIISEEKNDSKVCLISDKIETVLTDQSGSINSEIEEPVESEDNKVKSNIIINREVEVQSTETPDIKDQQEVTGKKVDSVEVDGSGKETDAPSVLDQQTKTAPEINIRRKTVEQDLEKVVCLSEESSDSDTNEAIESIPKSSEINDLPDVPISDELASNSEVNDLIEIARKVELQGIKSNEPVASEDIDDILSDNPQEISSGMPVGTEENLETILAVAALQNEAVPEVKVERRLSEKELREMEAIRMAVASITDSSQDTYDSYLVESSITIENSIPEFSSDTQELLSEGQELSNDDAPVISEPVDDSDVTKKEAEESNEVSPVLLEENLNEETKTEDILDKELPDSNSENVDESETVVDSIEDSKNVTDESEAVKLDTVDTEKLEEVEEVKNEAIPMNTTEKNDVSQPEENAISLNKPVSDCVLVKEDNIIEGKEKKKDEVLTPKLAEVQEVVQDKPVVEAENRPGNDIVEEMEKSISEPVAEENKVDTSDAVLKETLQPQKLEENTSVPEQIVESRETVDSEQPAETTENMADEKLARNKTRRGNKVSEPLSINVEELEKKDKPYSPKVTIKPVKVPDEEVSTTSDAESNKGSLKITITKQSDKMHSILKVFNPEDESEPVQNQDEPIPKLIIKPKMQQVEQQHSPKMSTRSAKVYSPTSTQRCGSPRVTIKPVIKPVEPKSEALSPLKITFKPVVKPEEGTKRHSPKIPKEQEQKNHNPKITIKPIPKPVVEEKEEPSVVTTKLTIKPIKRPHEDTDVETEQERSSPKITIKPLVKPVDQDVDHSNQATPKLKIKAIRKLEDEENNMGEKDRDSPKISIKPVIKPTEIEEEEEVKERIVLKINKGNLPTPSKESRKREYPEDEKIEKMGKLRLKFSTMGGQTHIVQESDEANKKQKKDSSHLGKKDEESPNKRALDEKPVERNKKLKNSSPDKVINDSRVEVTIKDQKLNCPVVSTENSRSHPSADHVTAEASHVTNPDISKIADIASRTTHIEATPIVTVGVVTPSVTPGPKRRGRPRKVPLEIREELQDPPTTPQTSPQTTAPSSTIVTIPAASSEPGTPATTPSTQGRPKRSCRGQNVIATLGIKPRKPRGRGRGSKVNMGDREPVSTVAVPTGPVQTVPMKPEKEQKLTKAKIKLIQKSVEDDAKRQIELLVSKDQAKQEVFQSIGETSTPTSSIQINNPKPEIIIKEEKGPSNPESSDQTQVTEAEPQSIGQTTSISETSTEGSLRRKIEEEEDQQPTKKKKEDDTTPRKLEVTPITQKSQIHSSDGGIAEKTNNPEASSSNISDIVVEDEQIVETPDLKTKNSSEQNIQSSVSEKVVVSTETGIKLEAETEEKVLEQIKTEDIKLEDIPSKDHQQQSETSTGEEKKPEEPSAAEDEDSEDSEIERRRELIKQRKQEAIKKCRAKRMEKLAKAAELKRKRQETAAQQRAAKIAAEEAERQAAEKSRLNRRYGRYGTPKPQISLIDEPVREVEGTIKSHMGLFNPQDPLLITHSIGIDDDSNQQFKSSQSSSSKLLGPPEAMAVDSMEDVRHRRLMGSEDPMMVDEDTRMSADFRGSRAQTPAKQMLPPPEAMIEDSQGSMGAESGSAKFRGSKTPKMEVFQDLESVLVTADHLAEYSWNGRGPFMIQEQVAQFLGIKSFKRKYPNCQRRPVDMQERDYLKENGFVTEAQCDLGLTAVNAQDILDIMYTDFQDKYEEYCKVQREKQARELANKQKAMGQFSLKPGYEKMDMIEQAVQSAASWNQQFNKKRREERKAHMDLQNFTVHYPKSKMKALPIPKIGDHPIALVPGQFTDYYKEFTPTELNNLPLNTMCYDEIKVPDVESDSEESSSDSDSESDNSSNSSSSESSCDEDCKDCEKHDLEASGNVTNDVITDNGSSDSVVLVSVTPATVSA